LKDTFSPLTKNLSLWEEFLEERQMFPIPIWVPQKILGLAFHQGTEKTENNLMASNNSKATKIIATH
jgi:hypothetical protein